MSIEQGIPQVVLSMILTQMCFTKIFSVCETPGWSLEGLKLHTDTDPFTPISQQSHWRCPWLSDRHKTTANLPRFKTATSQHKVLVRPARQAAIQYINSSRCCPSTREHIAAYGENISRQQCSTFRTVPLHIVPFHTVPFHIVPFHTGVTPRYG